MQGGGLSASAVSCESYFDTLIRDFSERFLYGTIRGIQLTQAFLMKITRHLDIHLNVKDTEKRKLSISRYPIEAKCITHIGRVLSCSSRSNERGNQIDK